jgi:DNA primase
MMTGLDHYRRLFGPAARRSDLDRDSLPDPEAYLRQRGLLTQRTRGEWVSLRCPAHKDGDEAHPSLRISLRGGHFRCHACGASGGDILALHRLMTGLRFRDAARDLGARFHDD